MTTEPLDTPKVDRGSSLSPDGALERSTRLRRLQLFMGTRLSVATLLLGGTLFLAVEGSRSTESFTPRFLIALIGLTYGTSLVTAVWMLGGKRQPAIAKTQLAADLLLTTGIIYVTGGTASGFTFLYGVAVLMGAMVLGAGTARTTGLTAIGLYVLVIGCLWFGLFPPPPDQSPDAYQPALDDLLYAGTLHVSGLALVTFLATSLAQRLQAAGGELLRAEASAVRLARLNDDIVRSMSSGLLTTDERAHIHTINALGANMFNCPADLIAGRSINELLPDAHALVEEALSQNDATITRAETLAQRPGGGEFPAGFSVTRLINVEGEAIGALIVFQDLTEIEELRRSAARQERLAVLGRLSAGLAHEIRNPLSSISGSVQLVRDATGLGDEDKRLLGIVLDEVDRLNDLVTTMLQVGSPRQPQKVRLDLRNIVEDVTRVAEQQAKDDGAVALTMDLPSSPVVAEVDTDQVRQVLWNLVKNAIQASPPGSTVTLSTRSAAGRPQLRVADEGDGLDEAQQTRVYEMFHSERTHGAGIGLALVRQIVDAHRGSVEIDSASGKGARFIVTFPPPSSDSTPAHNRPSGRSARRSGY